MAQNLIENIFTEIEIQCLNTTKDIIIEFMILIHSFSIRNNQTFYKKYTKENKFIYLMDGYYNIDSLNVPKNEYIQEFLDIVMQITWFLLLLSQLHLKQGH